MIYIVIPCYNEEEILKDTTERLLACLLHIPFPVTILYVDDGSSDNTWSIISSLSGCYENVIGLRLSRNVGQQTATWAGMEYCIKDADALICMDADLQDDISVLPRMVRDFKDGFDVVYGVRSDRSSDDFIKRATANVFYKTMKWLGCEMVENHSEFRLLSKRAALALLSYSERNVFIRCVIPQLGFRNKKEYYSRQPRILGTTKYSYFRLIGLALDGITNFSVRPIRWIQIVGCMCILTSFCVIAWAIANYVMGKTALGWPSLLISMWLLSGVILLSIGITGEYIGKIYTETKRRPRYFIMDETL